MNTTQKAILLDLFHKNAKAKATGKFKEAEEIEADFLNVLNALTFEARKESLEEEIDNLKERLFKDTAGGASTFLHYAREHLNGLWERKRLLFEMGAIDIDEEDYLQDKLKEIQAEIFKRLQDRLYWIADRLEDSIEARKKAGTYKGEFTTATILANAFNDIFKNNFEQSFTGER